MGINIASILPDMLLDIMDFNCLSCTPRGVQD